MRTAYRVIAYLIALDVLVQAAAIAYAVFGLSAWIEGGGVLDKAAMESETIEFTGVGGFPLHALNGTFLFPLLALALVVVALFARVHGGLKWAGIVFGLVVLQVLLGMFARDLAGLGALHGLNALALFTVALVAARSASGDRPGSGRESRLAEPAA